MKTAWDKYQSNKEIMEFSEGYKSFLTNSKTERRTCFNAIELAKKYGYKDIKEYQELKPNDKVYINNRNKALALFTIGQEDIENGLNILGAHIDSPCLHIRQEAIYEQSGLVFLDTHYYGGVKKYQWVAHPMALVGVVCKKDGTTVEISIGENDDDPVVGISDLLIHLSAEQMQKPGSKVVEAEALNVLFGSIPKKDVEKEACKAYILDLLKEKYDIEEADFMSAEITVVPAGKAKDYGLDRSMVLGYGHDDRICAYTSLMAMLDTNNPHRTTCCILTDKEEVGSQGNTGAHGRFFENAVAEIISKTTSYNDLKLRHCLTNSFMLSSDVSAGFDPNYPSVNEIKNAKPRNTAFMGKGLVFNKFTGSRGKVSSNDANAEYIAKVRKVMADNNIDIQTAELGKMDLGGGGTIAYILANLDIEVIDAGIAVQNMHACYEVASKVDIYEAYKGYKAFLKDIK